MKKIVIFIFVSCSISLSAFAQDYFIKSNSSFDENIKSPEVFLGYPIGSHHTRHDRLAAYFEYLSEASNKAKLQVYGETYEKRPLIILTISSKSNINNLDELKKEHLKLTDPTASNLDFTKQPVFINLGYGVHGNEPSSSEAAMLTAYTLIASQNTDVKNYLENAVIFIDPTINPDGRERHTQWANMYKADPLVADPMDAEHNEAWPRGRTNHYWFDLNRDWYLAINPESRGKLSWYHEWYPNAVTDFHEMGTNSTYFFEPKKANASKNPIMPKDNYIKLNDTYAKYFAEELDKIGSLYFSKEIFDGTYPGYGSSYPDLQGALALLFEQASSRGHLQERARGEITFAFTIRNHYVSSMATVRATVENKQMMLKYQNDFFKSAIQNAKKNGVKAYVFGDEHDKSRTMAFIDKLLMHQIKVY
ncbi:MAG: zinc carboxypeptidase, partial [Cyclobacteriaceae bacterium]|nr:zinc carboxypeptidase [Cyclobacteriaceae bacterium]